MARIRSVHPSLFTDEAWVSCAPLARVLYIGLMTDADDQGLFEWKPLQIRMRLLPGDNADVAALLQELADANLIAPLESAGKKLGAIRYFRRFQRPKKPNSTFVLPAEFRTYVGLSDDGSELSDDQDGESTEPEFVNAKRVPKKGEKSPQMEDGGGVGSLFSDADASSVGLAEPITTAKALWERDPDFLSAWSACSEPMRTRSSRKAAHAAWRQNRAAGPAKLTALKAYLAKDPDVQRTGGPGFHLWLRDKLEEWLIADPAVALGAGWPDSRWTAAMGLWRADGSWDDRLGPTPGQPGCRVPSHLLIQGAA